MTELDQKGYVDIAVVNMKVPQFSYLFSEALNNDLVITPDLAYKVRIMTQEYWEEQC